MRILIISIFFISIFYINTINAYSKGKILTISDIHFDPFDDCKGKSPCKLFDQLNNSEVGEWDNIFYKNSLNLKPMYGKDTNYILLKNFFFNNKNSINKFIQNNNIISVIILGDFLAHNLKNKYILYYKSEKGYKNFVKKLMYYISDQINLSIHSVAPNVPVYPLLGNNDSYFGSNYVDEKESDFYKDTLNSWIKLNNKIDPSTFLESGYYYSDLKDTNLRFIFLNSNLFSFMAKSTSNNILQKINEKIKIVNNLIIFNSNLLPLNEKFASNDILQKANEQLVWLNRTLNEAKKYRKKVIISFHIPTHFDEYSSNRFGVLIPYWQKLFYSNYIEILENYRENIIGVLNSHTHFDEVHIETYKDKKLDIFSISAPSVSPNHFNNPGFKVIYLSENLNAKGFQNIQDYDSFYYPLEENEPQIKFGYNFNHTYKSHDISEGIQNIIEGKFKLEYFKNYNLMGPEHDDKNRKNYTCFIKYSLSNDYKNCIQIQ